MDKKASVGVRTRREQYGGVLESLKYILIELLSLATQQLPAMSVSSSRAYNIDTNQFLPTDCLSSVFMALYGTHKF